MTTKLWREAEDMRLSRAVYINHIDRENANFDAAMALLHARFGGRLGAVTIPIGQAEEFQGVCLLYTSHLSEPCDKKAPRAADRRPMRRSLQT